MPASIVRAAQLGDEERGAFSVPNDRLIESAAEAVDVFDLEAVARHKMPPTHYGNIAAGAGSGRTLVRNREAFDLYAIQSRRMINVSHIDPSVELFGARHDFPLLLAPCGNHRVADPEGELATARGAASRNSQMVLSTYTSVALEQVAAARGTPVWFQLYPQAEWDVTQGLLRRAERAASPVIVVTVDGLGARRQVLERYRRIDERDCSSCHGTNIPLTPGYDPTLNAPMFSGMAARGMRLLGPSLDWNFMRRLRQATDRKLLVKGILSADDAARAVDERLDGVIVSNHGGRAFDTGISTIELLPEIVAAVAGRVPVLIDGGFRRGSDVFKALALGARAVLIGRPYLWGLAAFGESGVSAALRLMQTELLETMRTAGTISHETIDAQKIRRQPVGSHSVSEVSSRTGM